MLHRERAFNVLVLFAFLFGPAPAFAGLEEYVRKSEPAFGWKLNEKIEQAGGRIFDLHFVSQTWQRNTWEHQL